MRLSEPRYGAQGRHPPVERLPCPLCFMSSGHSEYFLSSGSTSREYSRYSMDCCREHTRRAVRVGELDTRGATSIATRPASYESSWIWVRFWEDRASMVLHETLGNPRRGSPRATGAGAGGGYACIVRVTVSIPDSVRVSADELARRLGVSRSELYSRAVREYLAAHSPDRVTEALDRVVATIEADGDFADEAARRMLKKMEW